jgi:hypothetical protein
MPRVRVQWTTNPATDWIEFDVTPTGQGAQRWRNLARKALPQGGETIDSQPGWIFSVEVDGVLVYGFDKYAADFVGSGSSAALRVFGWVDDVGDFGDPQSAGYRWAEVWTFHQHRPDPRFGGQMNTWQTKTVYAEDLVDMARFFPQSTTGGEVQLRPWSEFPTPPDALTRFGIWVRDEALWQQHFQVRRPVTWRDWS